MDTPNDIQVPPVVNPITQAAHRRQVWTQILIPIIGVAVLLLGAAILATRGSNPQVAQLGNVSAVIVIMPFLIILLVSFVIFLGLIYAFARLIKVLPPYANLAQIFIENLHQRIKRVADLAAQPMITSEGFWAGVKKIFGK
jgi:ethanolamine transporter EutH